MFWVNRIPFIGAVLVASLGSTALGQVTLSDSTFASASWTPLIPSTTVTFSQNTTGGDPGSFGEVTLSEAATGSPIAIGDAFLSSGLTYTPSVQGAIQSLSFSLNAEAVRGSSQVILVVKQDSGLTFLSTGPGTVTSTSWQSYSENLLTALENSSLNFSATGDPMGFGIYVNASSASGGINSAVGVDNLAININVAPEPSALALMLTAGIIGSFGLKRFRISSR
jgi:hypothetical protein